MCKQPEILGRNFRHSCRGGCHLTTYGYCPIPGPIPAAFTFVLVFMAVPFGLSWSTKQARGHAVQKHTSKVMPFITQSFVFKPGVRGTEPQESTPAKWFQQRRRAAGLPLDTKEQLRREDLLAFVQTYVWTFTVQLGILLSRGEPCIP